MGDCCGLFSSLVNLHWCYESFFLIHLSVLYNFHCCWPYYHIVALKLKNIPLENRAFIFYSLLLLIYLPSSQCCEPCLAVLRTSNGVQAIFLPYGHTDILNLSPFCNSLSWLSLRHNLLFHGRIVLLFSWFYIPAFRELQWLWRHQFTNSLVFL